MPAHSIQPFSTSLHPNPKRVLSSPQRITLSPRLSATSIHFSDASESSRRASLGLEARLRKRGLTLEEVEDYGLVDENEHSKLFERIPISDEDIGKLPRKVSSSNDHNTVVCSSQS